jgi:hypothetical protein
VCPPSRQLCKRLLERVGRDRGAVACESEAGLVAFSVNYFAGDYLKMPLVLPVPATDVPTIEPNNDLGRLLRCGGIRPHNGLTDRMVLLRTVPAFAAPLTGSNSATLPNGANAAYRAVT